MKQPMLPLLLMSGKSFGFLLVCSTGTGLESLSIREIRAQGKEPLLTDQEMHFFAMARCHFKNFSFPHSPLVRLNGNSSPGDISRNENARNARPKREDAEAGSTRRKGTWPDKSSQ